MIQVIMTLSAEGA